MIASPTQAHLFWKIVSIGLLALALLGFSSLIKKEYRLAIFGEKSTGIVKKVETITTSTDSKWVQRGNTRVAIPRGGDLTFMTIGFMTKAGNPVQVETLATFNTVAKEGDSHPMIYLPATPENAKIYSAKQLWLPMCVGTIFSTVCLALGIWLVRKPAPTAPVRLAEQSPSKTNQPPVPLASLGPITFPSLRKLYGRDFPFYRAINAVFGGIIVTVGFYWATRPIPGVAIEPSPERDAMPYIMLAATVVAVFGAFFAIRRHRTLGNTLRNGLLVKGMVDKKDVYVRRTDDQSDSYDSPSYSSSYVITVSYGYNGESYQKRIQLPLSPSTYGAHQGKEIDLVLLPETPAKPLVREVYLGRF